MESWGNGRETLLLEVGRAYDLIGARLAAELDEENTARIPKLQWANLQEEAAYSGELEQENARLAGELERCQNVTKRAEKLEQDNKRLQRDLESVLKKQKQPHHLAVATPVRGVQFEPSSISPVSTSKIETKSATKTVSGERFSDLATRYNRVHDNWQHEKRKKEEWKEKCERQWETLAQWEATVRDQKGQIEQKDIVIRNLRDSLGQGRDLTIGALRPQRPASSMPLAKKASWQPQTSQSNPFSPKTTDSESRDEVARTPYYCDRANSMVVPQPSEPSGNADDVKSPDLRAPTGCYALVRGDSEDEEGIRLPESLPQLPVSSDQRPLIDHHHSSTTDDGPSPRRGQRQDVEVPMIQRPRSQEGTPQFLSARRVKKRKAATTASPKRKVKIEILSSPTGLVRIVNSSDSLDLDDIGEKTDTPKKQCRLQELSQGRRAMSDDFQSPKIESQKRELDRLRAMSEQISQETPIRQVGLHRRGTALQPLSVNKQILPRTSGGRKPKRRRIEERAVEDLVEDGEIYSVWQPGRKDHEGKLLSLLEVSSPAKAILSPARSIDSAAKSPSKISVISGLSIDHKPTQDRVLEWPKSRRPEKPNQAQPMSANTFRSTETSTDKSRRPSSRESDEPKQRSPKGSGRIFLSARPIAWDMSTTTRATELTVTNFETPLQRVTKAATTSAQSNKFASTIVNRQPRTKQTAEEWKFDPEQEPLRLRPVETLRLEDFKINPNYNQGYDYAFGEVVRDRSSRQDLQGCTKPGCCGEKFRALAMASRNPNLPLTIAQEEANDELLEDFLGDNFYKLGSMSKAQRDEVLLQAMTRQLANQHGRHRHAYERPATPPGFWRTDFPTTQEEAEDRAKALGAYKIQVQQRYEEAMRQNGRYIFKDE